MDWFTGKNGILTKAVESIPGGGYITAPIHKLAGHDDHCD